MAESPQRPQNMGDLAGKCECSFCLRLKLRKKLHSPSGLRTKADCFYSLIRKANSFEFVTRQGEGSEHCDSRGPLSSIGKIQDSVLNYRHWILTSKLCSDKCKMGAGLSLFRWTERTMRQNLGILRCFWALLHATLSHLLHDEKTMEITLFITEPVAVALRRSCHTLG